MPNLSTLTHYHLKVIFAVHFILITWGIQGSWCPKSAMFYNFLFLTCILWAVHSYESDEPVQFALFINIASIFLDIVTLSIYFPEHYASDKFSAAIMIVNMIVRVVSSYCLLQIGQARGGSLSTMLTPSPAMGFGRQEYEDMSQPVPNNSDFA